MSDDIKCPVCNTWTKDDITVYDHGMCYDCHKDWLNGDLELED